MTSIPDDFIEIWKKFKKVRLHLSIDDLYERNDYIRYGSKWETIYNNFLKIIEYKDIFRIEVCQTISALNVYNIDEFKRFFNQFDLIIAHNYVHHPSFLHVSVIPYEMKEEIKGNLKNLRQDEIDRLLTEIDTKRDESDVIKFKKFISMLDIKRNASIGDSLKEWKKHF
jgi:hypothetical protein